MADNGRARRTLTIPVVITLLDVGRALTERGNLRAVFRI